MQKTIKRERYIQKNEKQNIYHTVGTGPKMEDKGKSDTLCTQILSRLGTGNSIECAEMRGG